MVLEEHTMKMQLVVKGPAVSHTREGQGRCSSKLLLFWCPNMLKQPVYGMFLGLINPQILFFLKIELKNLI